MAVLLVNDNFAIRESLDRALWVNSYDVQLASAGDVQSGGLAEHEPR